VTGLDGIGLYALRREQVAGVLAACRSADALARRVTAVLDAAGLGEVVLEVVGVVDGAGRPVACVTITLDGARRLTRLLVTRPGLLPIEVMHPPHNPDDPHGASEAA
jgi:hypothetical protein